jgi:hypothetical protein
MLSNHLTAPGRMVVDTEVTAAIIALHRSLDRVSTDVASLND